MTSMTRDFYEAVNGQARACVPRGAPFVAVGHPLIGRVGHMSHRGFTFESGLSERHFQALLRDELRLQQAPNWWTFRRVLRDVRMAQFDELGAITTWDGILGGRSLKSANSANGYTSGPNDQVFVKSSQTTVALQWSHFARSGGNPGAAAYTAAAGNGAIMNVASTGAPLLTNPAAEKKKYLTNVGLHILTGTSNYVMMIDLLYAAGAISTTTTSTTTIAHPTLTRYTDGVGVMMTLEVDAALGSTASNVTVGYDGSATAALSSAATAMTTSCITFRLQPLGTTSPQYMGAQFPLPDTESGVKAINSVAFSASMGGTGTVAALLYKPLVYLPSLVVTNYYERCLPAMLDGLAIAELAYGTDSQLGFLSLIINTQTTSTSAIQWFVKTVEEA